MVKYVCVDRSHADSIDVEITTYDKYCSPSRILLTAAVQSARISSEKVLAFSWVDVFKRLSWESTAATYASATPEIPEQNYMNEANK